MPVSFDTDKKTGKRVTTRLYAPNRKTAAQLQVSSDGGTAVHPQPRPEETAREIRTQAAAPEKDGKATLSRILLLLAVFLIAATAILAIDGNAKVTKIYTQIYELEDQIEEYENKISLLQKEQSSMNDYATINEANREAGRVMNWDMNED